MTFTELSRRVRAHLAQDHRYDHTVRVARCADVLAQRHGLDARKARLAGMLHDLARLYPAERLVAECEARGVPIEPFERAHPIVLHARLGALIAAESFGVHDDQVLSAIAKHTTGAADMSPLDCVVFLADGLEPERTFSERAALWELAKTDLAVAVREVLRSSMQHLARKGLPVAPATIAAARSFGISSQEVGASAN